MKTNLALMAAGAFVLAPAVVASQPAQTPPAQSATQAQSSADRQEPAATSKAAADSACDRDGKSSTAESKSSHSSAKVGKDTGDLPPPRKKESKDTACAPQPQ